MKLLLRQIVTVTGCTLLATVAQDADVKVRLLETTDVYYFVCAISRTLRS